MYHNTHCSPFWKSTVASGMKNPFQRQTTEPIPVASHLAMLMFWSALNLLHVHGWHFDSLATFKCSLYVELSVMKDSLFVKGTSSSGHFWCWCEAVKLPSIANEQVYTHLQETEIKQSYNISHFRNDLLIVILLPVIWKIYAWLRACWTLNGKLSQARWPDIMAKAMPLQVFEIPVLPCAS